MKCTHKHLVITMVVLQDGRCVKKQNVENVKVPMWNIGNGTHRAVDILIIIIVAKIVVIPGG